VSVRSQRKHKLFTGMSTHALPTCARLSEVKLRRGPAGVHLFSRKTGLNLLVDEVRIRRAFWDKAPRHMSMALTNACNLSCDYCYAAKHSASLDFEKVLEWLTELDSNGCVGVGFGGGEPTLYRKLPEICEFATRKTLLAVSITSHGHLFHDGLIDRLGGNIHFLRISMDGVGSTYETLRGQRFDALLERIRAIRRLSPFGINFVVNSRTFPDLTKAAQISEDLGACEFALLPEVPTIKSCGIDGLTRMAMVDWIANYRGSVPLSISELGAAGLPVCVPFAKEKGLRAHAHIDASARLKRCSYDRDGVAVGASGIMEALLKLWRHRKEVLQ
jgi:sulfatase maturation enzyme AslB (radical SAM superfamily)